MYTRSRVMLCREGWYYLFVFIFILLGAAIREANLLLAMAGLLVGPLLFNWRVVVASLRNLRVMRRAPQLVIAGEPFRVSLTLANCRSFLPSWMLLCQDRIQPQLDPHRSQRATGEALFAQVPPLESRTVDYSATLPVRGRYQLGPVTIASRFPLGLVRGSATQACEGEILAAPRIGVLNEHWRSLVTGGEFGELNQRRQGSQGEFYGIREWRPGDSTRLIHWRTAARLGKLAVRQFEQERAPRMSLLVDLWVPESPGPPDWERVELALSFAATAIHDAVQQGRMRIAVAISSAQCQHWIGVASPLLLEEILREMATLVPGRGEHLAAAQAAIQHAFPQASASIVLSTRPSWPPQGVPEAGATRPTPGQPLWLEVGGDAAGTRYFQPAAAPQDPPQVPPHPASADFLPH